MKESCVCSGASSSCVGGGDFVGVDFLSRRFGSGDLVGVLCGVVEGRPLTVGGR